MGYLLGACIAAGMAVLTLRPYWALCLYLLMSTAGILGYLTAITFSPFPYLLQCIALLAIALAGADLRQQYLAGRQPYPVFATAFLIAVLAACICAVNLAVDGIGGTLHTMHEFPLLWFIPAMAYWKNRQAQALFLAVLAIHLALAFTMLVFPGGFLDNFSAIHYIPTYQGMESVGESFEWQVARIQDVMPVMGHFGNQNCYAQTSTVGVLIGLWLFFKRAASVIRFSGLGLLVLGIVGIMASFGRSAGLGLVLGSCVFLTMRSRQKVAVTAAIGLVAAGLAYFISRDLWLHLHDLYFSYDENFEYRLAALANMGNYVAHYGLAGVPSTLHHSGELLYSPHETISHMTYRFGAAAGLTTVFFEVASLWGGGRFYARIAQTCARTATPLKPFVRQDDIAVFRASAVCMIIAGLGNAFAGGYGYWVWFFACCIPWFYAKWEWKRHVRAAASMPETQEHVHQRHHLHVPTARAA